MISQTISQTPRINYSFNSTWDCPSTVGEVGQTMVKQTDVLPNFKELTDG